MSYSPKMQEVLDKMRDYIPLPHFGSEASDFEKQIIKDRLGGDEEVKKAIKTKIEKIMKCAGEENPAGASEVSKL